MESTFKLPHWILIICGITTIISIIISLIGIYLQLKNYRKPFEQRLIVRILVIVPLFAISCYSKLINNTIGSIIEPIREIYEAFVIYTFYKLLVLMLGGERKIILMTLNKEPISHLLPINLILGKINISHPKDFLTIKRCILQYVWVKPLLFLIIYISKIIGIYQINNLKISSISLWIGLLYNLSVTISLYSLGIFWKCLYDELNIFQPWSKFLCVKLIIFASYWQGILIGIMNWFGIFENESAGEIIQNGLLSFEMIFFAILHWKSFPYKDFTINKIPDSSKMEILFAIKDFINIGDLIYDLKITTMYGDNYNLRNFDAITDSKIYDKSDTFNQKIYQGLRISGNGKKYWINVDPESGIDNESVKSGNNNNNISNNNNNNSMKGIPRLSKLSEIVRNNNNNGDTITTPLLEESNNIITNNNNYLSNINEVINEFDDDEPFINEDDFNKDEKLYQYVKRHYIPDETINYPVEYEIDMKNSNNSDRINKLRERVRSNSRLV